MVQLLRARENIKANRIDSSIEQMRLGVAVLLGPVRSLSNTRATETIRVFGGQVCLYR